MHQYQDRGLQQENIRLREENARLKTENRRLHDELAESAGANETLLATNRRMQGQQMRSGSAPYGQPDPRALAAFRQFDKNGSGKLDYRELRNACAVVGIDCTTGEAVAALKAYGTDGSGLIDLHEFASLTERLGLSAQTMQQPSRLSAPHDAPLDSRVAAAFRRYDRNSSGQLDYRELRGSMGELGIDCTTEEAMRVLQAYDTDGKGMLDLYEFAGLAQRLGLSAQGGGMLGGGGMGMQGAMTPYGGGGAGGYAGYGSMGRSTGPLALGRLGSRSPGPRGGGFEHEGQAAQAEGGDFYFYSSTAWKRLPKNVAHWATADVVSWLVMVDETCFVEAFVRRQITGVTLLSLHLSSADAHDGYEHDNSPTDLRHVMAGVGVAAVDELRLRALVEHVAMLRKQNRRARHEHHDHTALPLGYGQPGMGMSMGAGMGAGMGMGMGAGGGYSAEHDSNLEVEEAVRRRNRGWSVDHEYAAWRKLCLFRAHQALYEQHKEATRSWVWLHYRLLLLLSSLATVLGIVAVALFPNGDVDRVGTDSEDVFDSAKVGSLRWSWSLGTTLLALAVAGLSSALLRHSPKAERTLEACDVAVAQYEKLVGLYSKTLKAPVAKRQEHADFSAASDAVEAERPPVTLSAREFGAAAARVKRHNTPVWRNYFRYCVVSEEARCCGLSGEVLGTRFNSFEFPPSRVVGICLVHKLSEEALGRQLESTEAGDGARRAFDVFFARELANQPVARLAGARDGAFVDPFCEPLRSLVPLEGGPRQTFPLSAALCNEVLARFLASKSSYVRGSATTAHASDPGPHGRAASPKGRTGDFGSPARRSQTADVPVPTSLTSFAV